MNILESLHFFYLRKILPGLRINKKAFVVDIGSGDKPFWRADIYVDKLSLGNVQRASSLKTIHDIGIFVDSDAGNLPFKDKIFDFSFCSHLLEHVDNPGIVIKEIVRVSKSGYVEVPNGILETIKPFDSHLWFVFQNKNKLIFIRKGKRLHDILLSNGIKYNNVLGKIKEPFIRLYWKNKIDFEIIDEYSNSDKFKSRVGNNKSNLSESMNLYIIMIKIIRKILHTEKNIVEVKNKIFNKS